MGESNVIALLLLLLMASASGQDIERNVKTAYDAKGRPAFQSENNRGYHTILDQTTLSNGRDTVNLNTSVADGRQDISFYSKDSFSGVAWSTTEADTNTYRVIPLSGASFIILSSDTAYAGTVNYKVEGL